MNRRRNLLSKHPLEWKYLKLVALAMFLPTLLIGGCLYYIIWQTVARELAVPELIAESLFPAFDAVNRIILVGLPIVFVVILFFATKLTHRLAGPLYRIEKELSHMTHTRDFSKPIRTRNGDELHSLVNKINHAITAALHQPRIGQK